MEFWRFINDPRHLGEPMAENYNLWLVVLSIMVASLGAYTALAVVDRIAATSKDWVKAAWLLLGATAFGCGVWAMHFVGMLAFSLPVAMSYDLSLTLASFIPAFFGSGVALHVMSRCEIKWWRLQLGALLMAVGIGTMHYTGMEAMQLNALMRYDFSLFILSILVAHLLASVALYIKFFSDNRTVGAGVVVRLGSATAMGTAVAAMHYTAMAAAQFYPATLTTVHSMILPPTELGIFVAVITSLIIGFAIVGTVVDRRLAETSQSLKESEKFAHLLLESAGEGICGIDEDSNITFVNPAAAEMLGFNSSELIGQPITRLTDDDTCVSLPRKGNKPGHHFPEKKDGVPIATTFTRKDGKMIPVELTSTYIQENGISVGRVFTFRDITERMQAETDLRESEEKFRQIVEQTQEVLCLMSSDSTQIVYISPSYEKIWGQTCASLYSKPTSWHDSIYLDDQHRVQSAFLNKARHGEEYTEEFRIVRPDGSICWILDHCFPIRDANGNLKHIAWFAKDISERKQMETELRLAQKLEAVGQLAAGIAHEINTPAQYVGDNIDFLENSLSEMVGITDICAKYCQAAISGPVSPETAEQAQAALDNADLCYIIEEAPKALAQSKEGIQQISKIVQAMKAFSHPGGEHMEYTDLNSLIKNTATVTRSEWKFVADIVFDLDPTAPKVRCHPQAIGQVILNLIVNASHAIRDTIDQAPGEMGQITISTARSDEEVRICVADTGPGIPEAIQHKIFDPFYTTKGVGVGTGQGLSLARTTIVDGHGGTLDFQTIKGQGTQFFVRLKIDNSDHVEQENVA